MPENAIKNFSDLLKGFQPFAVRARKRDLAEAQELAQKITKAKAARLAKRGRG